MQPKSLWILFSVLPFVGSSLGLASPQNVLKTPAEEIVDATGFHLEVPKKPPIRIIALTPALAEVTALFLGKDHMDRIVGVTEYTDEPAILKKQPLVGTYTRFNLEEIVRLKPDLVIATQDGNPRDQVLHLRDLHLRVLVVRSGSFAEILESFHWIGQAIGRAKEAERAIYEFEMGLERIKTVSTSEMGPKPKVLLQLSDSPFIAVGGKGFLNDGLEWIGVENVFKNIPKPYPQISWELGVQASPDSIFYIGMEDRGESDPAFQRVLSSWSRFPSLPVVKRRSIEWISARELTRPTPRLIQGLEALKNKIFARDDSGKKL